MQIPNGLGTTLVARRPDLVAKLSEREREVLVFALEGATCVSIAKRLHRTTHTVWSHLKSTHHKLGVTKREHLILLFAWFPAEQTA